MAIEVTTYTKDIYPGNGKLFRYATKHMGEFCGPCTFQSCIFLDKDDDMALEHQHIHSSCGAIKGHLEAPDGSGADDTPPRASKGLITLHTSADPRS